MAQVEKYKKISETSGFCLDLAQVLFIFAANYKINDAKMKQGTQSATACGTPSNSRPAAIYVHGLASGANAATGKALSKRFNNFNWITTDFGEDLAANVRQLNECVKEHKPLLIVGTSMGGLTLLYADAPDAVKIAINPALSIADCVRNTIGLGIHPYFCKRMNGATEFELTEQMCCDWERYIATHTPSLGKSSLLCLLGTTNCWATMPRLARRIYCVCAA